MRTTYEAPKNHTEVCLQRIRDGLQDENVLNPKTSEEKLDDFLYKAY